MATGENADSFVSILPKTYILWTPKPVRVLEKNHCSLVALLAAISLFHNVDSSTYVVALLGCDATYDNGTTTNECVYEFVVVNTEYQPIQVNVTDISAVIHTMKIAASDKESYIIDSRYGLRGYVYSNDTIMVSGDANFKLYVFSTSNSHTEGFLAIPLEDLLGPHNVYDVYEYVITTFCATSGYCQLAVAAFENATVKFTFPERASDIVFCLRQKYFRSSRDTVLNMASYDVVQMETKYDLTGTHIYSFSPIAVFVGARNLSNGNKMAHMIEQFPTSSQWDNKYIVYPLGESGYGDIAKIATSSWNSTVVEMTGYGRFLLSSREVLTRRIYPDTYSMITSDNPIQVTLIAGHEDNAISTTSTDPNLSLTVVPGSSQTVNSTRITCGTKQTSMKLVVITGKTSLVPQLNGIDMTVADDMGVSDYKMYTKYGHGLIVNELHGERMMGLVQCENGAAFPLENKLTQSEEVIVDDQSSEGICIEGETFEYICDSYGNSNQIIPERSFEGFAMLNLRVKFCGTVILEFKLDNGSVIIRLSSSINTITVCGEGLCDETYSTTDLFNYNRDCQNDMAWYWVYQNTSRDSITLRLGSGPLSYSLDIGTYWYRLYDSGNSFYSRAKNETLLQDVPLPGVIRTFTMKGLTTNATFNYDLETEEGCAHRVSDWRCEDQIADCAFYSKAFCNQSEHSKFSEVYCPKYCGTCVPDVYGKRFIGVFPSINYETITFGGFYCVVNIRSRNTENNTQPNIAIASLGSIMHKFTNEVDSRVLQFSCDGNILESEPFTIVSDQDVMVTITAESSYDREIYAYNIYPTDTHDKEYMTMLNADKGFCYVLTDEKQATVQIHVPDGIDLHIPMLNIVGMSSSSIVVTRELYAQLELHTTDQNVGGIFLKSDKPISVFCGGEFVNTSFNQLLPSSVLSTDYRIPKFNFSTTNPPISVKVVVQALDSDTIVDFISEFGEFFILETGGDKAIVGIDTDTTHELLSNNPIAVALIVDFDYSNSSFILIPPVACFDANTSLDLIIHENEIDIYVVTDSGAPFLVVMLKDETQYIEMSNNSGMNDTERYFGVSVLHFMEGDVALTTPFIFKQIDQQDEDICAVSKPDVKDGVDNDCDGIIDEDVCCREDLDLDGDFSDDFSRIAEDYDDVPEEPVCIPINKPKGQCWTLCQCPCSWVENLLEANKLSQDEFMNVQMVKALEIQEQLTVYKKNLTKVTLQKISAEDSRQSAANVGYVGVALFMLTVAFIIFLDISAILRDLKILYANLSDGLESLRHCFCCK